MHMQTIITKALITAATSAAIQHLPQITKRAQETCQDYLKTLAELFSQTCINKPTTSPPPSPSNTHQLIGELPDDINVINFTHNLILEIRNSQIKCRLSEDEEGNQLEILLPLLQMKIMKMN